MGVITLNGKTSTSIGLQVESPPDYDIPERIYETTHVPGRNGDIVMDTGSYRNSTRTYEVSIGSEGGNFAALSSSIAQWLHSAAGYVRLEDSYTPDYYMLARYAEGNSIVNILGQAGRATLNFDRKPQRFLKSGDTPVTITTTKMLKNPTLYESKPLIKIIGDGEGTVSIGSYTIGVTRLSAYMYIDSDIEDVYKDALNMNNYVTLTNGFPLLKPGNNSISFTGGIESVEITPRWWTI